MNTEFFKLLEYIQKYDLTPSFNKTQIESQYRTLWSPLVESMLKKRTDKKTYIQGITAMQGTGKTTLCKILSFLLEHKNFNVISVSIDDFYRTYLELQELRKDNPEFIFRGPPGTHDLNLINNLFDALSSNDDQISIPRFDKSLHQGQGDRSGFEKISRPVDILLFEGWFVGFEPVENSLIQNSKLPEIQENLTLAEKSNSSLKEYTPIWDRLNNLLLMYPTDFNLSLKWRTEAENKMKKAGKSGMSDKQIEDFVSYFWGSLHPEIYINHLKKKTNVTKIKIDQNHLGVLE